jgi:Kef-type K+ transport system membrane component KefB
MFNSFAPQGADRVSFVLFVAVAMSITAFPVLARILTDQGLYHTPIGSLAMACAAACDIIAWCLLTVVVAFVKGGAPHLMQFPRVRVDRQGAVALMADLLLDYLEPRSLA